MSTTRPRRHSSSSVAPCPTHQHSESSSLDFGPVETKSDASSRRHSLVKPVQSSPFMATPEIALAVASTPNLLLPVAVSPPLPPRKVRTPPHLPLPPTPISPTIQPPPPSPRLGRDRASMSDLSASFPAPPTDFLPRAFSRSRAQPPIPTRANTAPSAVPPHQHATDSQGSRQWLTSAQDVPRFSRTALAGVVLPVPARDAKRSSNRVSLVHVHVPASPPTPRLSRGHRPGSRSSSSSGGGPATPSASSSAGHTATELDLGLHAMSVLMSDDEDEQAQVVALHSHGSHVRRRSSTSDLHDTSHRQKLAWSRSHRRSHAKGTSFLSFGSDDSLESFVHFGARQQSDASSTIAASMVTIPLSTHSQWAESPELTGLTSKQKEGSGTMKRIFKSFMKKGH